VITAEKVFADARLKLERCETLVVDLDSTFKAFFGERTDLMTVSLEPDSDGVIGLKVTATGQLPRNVATVVGDALHNLRSSLDVAVCGLVELAGVTPTRNAYFPIHSTREAVKEALARKDLLSLGAEVQRVILDSIRPYLGGADALYALHDLNKKDKHRHLLPVITVSRVDGIALRDDQFSIVEELTVYPGPTGVAHVISLPGKMEIRSKGRPSYVPVFGPDAGGQAGKPLMPTLQAIFWAVDRALGALQAAASPVAVTARSAPK
jgi:hypothetical protein